MDKWGELKLWLGKRHDYFEMEYRQNNLAADEIEAAAYRKINEVMINLEVKELKEKAQKESAPGVKAKRPPAR